MPSRIEDEIDPSTIAAEVIMLRAASDNTILILEGPSDERLFINFIETGQCEIVIAHGRYNAVTAATILKNRALSGILCIVDQDFGPILGDDPSTEHILTTDDHDLETMIFRSEAFDRVLAEYGSQAKIANGKSKWGELRTPIALAAYPIGLLRLYSLQNSVHLTFEGARPVYIDRRTLAIDVRLMIKTISDHSKKSVDLDDIRAFYDRWPTGGYDPWKICCGHDLTEIFGKSLQTLLGSRRAIEVDQSSTERALRLAYSFHDFRRTKLCKSIKSWEQSNSRICLRS
jgi:hypothetical protein